MHQRLDHQGRTGRVSSSRPANSRIRLSVVANSYSSAALISKVEKKPAIINIIEKNGISPNGVPAVMGAHLMASEAVAPFSTSKTAGDGPPHQFQYYSSEGAAQVLLLTTPANVAHAVVKFVVDAAAVAIKERGVFTLVISGGALPEQLSGLAKAKGVAWDKVWVFFADERNVPHSHADSNFRLAQEHFLSQVPVPPSQVISITENLPAHQAARAYEGALLALPPKVLPRTADATSPLPIFDQVLLGLGPDGHIASLFPNRPQLAAVGALSGAWVAAVEDSPKPPAARITLTLPVINAARDVVLVAVGAAKAEIVQRALEVQALPGSLPAQLVRPAPGKLRWVLDIEAAEKLDLAAWAATSAFPRSQ